MSSVDIGRRQVIRTGAGIALGGLMLNGLVGSQAARAKPDAARRVIIDTDPGVDDALAIFLALRSPELKVEAITAVAGNVPLSVTLPNALRLVEIAGRADIPVAAGAIAPLKRRLISAADFHGNNGLGGVQFPEPHTKPVGETASQIMRRIIRQSPGEISIIAIGPLTNVATAFHDDPGLAGQVRDITIMGGSLSGGNITPAAEFNAYVDPEAAQAVFQSGAPVTMVGLDVTRKVALDEARVRVLEAASDPVARASGRIMRAMLERAPGKNTKDSRMLVHDAMAVTAFIEPSLFRFDSLHIEVETQGEFSAGETLGYTHGPIHHSAPLDGSPPAVEASFKPNARVAMDVESGRAIDFLVGRLAAPGRKP